ncbi:cell wall surface anchor family protein [Filimonas lacunae]|nr:cell wall surface anchor family protein [Filimonas lacunae]
MTGATGGSYTSTSGLVINKTSGTVDLAKSGVGSYWITYSFSNSDGCTDTTGAAITIHALPTASMAYGTYCARDSAEVTLTGATGGQYTSTSGLVINKTSGTVDLAKSGVGSYWITYSFSNSDGCTDTTGASITIHALPTASIAYGTYCARDSAEVTLTGATGGSFTSTSGLVINKTSGTVDLVKSGVGSYWITYSFSNSDGCTDTTGASITIHALPTASIAYGTYCARDSAEVTLTGATGGSFTSTSGLVINKTSGTVDLVKSGVGSYWITYSFSNSDGCTDTTGAAITIHALPTATIAYGTYCARDSAEVTLTGATGGQYTSTSGLVINKTSGTVDLAKSTVGAYWITYSFSNSDGCTDTTGAAITIHALPTATIAYGTYCARDSAEVTLTGATGGSFTSTSGLVINKTSGTVDLAKSTVGAYWITYSFSNSDGCTDTTGAAITIHALPTATIAYGTYCARDSAEVTLTGATGGQYTSTSGLVINKTSGTVDLAKSGVGSYWITYSFSNSDGCTDTTGAAITIHALPTATIAYGTYCARDSAEVTLTGATGGQYTSTSGLVINKTSGTVDLAKSTVGAYWITYSFSNSDGCTDTTGAAITIHALPTATIAYGTYCARDSAEVTLTGATGGSFTSTSGLVINKTSGTVDLAKSTVGAYWITYSFSNSDGCTDTTGASITIHALPTATIAYGTYCARDSAEVTLTGATGGQYTSTSGLVINKTSGTVDLAKSGVGSYWITYSFSNSDGCTDTTGAAITIHALPTATIAYGTYCARDSAEVTLTGATGGSYTSTSGLVINKTSGTVDLAKSGVGSYWITYSFSNSDGCTDTTGAAITIHALPTASIAYGTYCARDSAEVTLTGATGGSFTSTSGLVINKTSGTVDLAKSTVGAYWITYSFSNSDGCTDTTGAAITIHALPTATIAYGTYCARDSAEVTLTGATGGQYTSTSGLVINKTSGTVDLAKSGVGSYWITYSFSNSDGCTDTTGAAITIHALPTATIAYGTYCARDSAEVTLTGATGGSFTSTSGLVINKTSGTVDLAKSGVGSYWITYSFSNSDGCTDTTGSSIVINALPVVPVITGASSVCINSTTQLTNAVSGGVWSSSDTTVATISNTGLVKAVGKGDIVITYTVTNTSGCSSDTTFQLSTLPIPAFSASGNSILCYGSTTGEITINAVETGLVYALNGGTYQSENVFKSLTAGTYTVAAKNAAGCVVTQTVSITQPDSLKLTDNIVRVGCHSSATGAVNVAIEGGVAPYSYAWSNGATTQNISELIAGTYTITVKDANGCIDSLKAVVTEVISVFDVQAPVTLANGQVRVTGTTIPGANVAVIYPNVSINKATAGADGSFAVTATPGVSSGSVIVTVTDPVTGITCSKTMQYVDASQSDVAITKTLVSKGKVTVGSYVTFVITATGKGPDDATNVVVTDPLVSLLDGVDSVSTTRGTVSYNSVTKKLEWVIDTLHADSSITLSFRVRVVAAGTLENTATIKANEKDPDTENNTASSEPVIVLKDFYIPNVITPNGNGKNDMFVIPGVPSNVRMDLIIFNRWGNEVYHNRNYDNTWDGKGLAAGVYYYVLKIIAPDGETPYKGYIQLLK